MEIIFELLKPLTDASWFAVATGFASLLNPVALFPALIAVIKSKTAEGQSVMMWFLFAFLQLVFGLVAAGAENSGMFIAMVISLFISVAIILIVKKKQSKV